MGWLAVYNREMLLMRKKIGKLGYAFSTLLFPLIYLFAFGWGIGPRMEVAGGYLPFLAKGMLAITVMLNSFQQTALSVSVGRFYFRTLQTLLLSPVSPLGIVVGLALAGVTRGLLAGGAVYLIAVAAFGVPGLSAAGLLGVVISAACFGALGIAVGMWVDHPDALSSVINFIITPMTFFCGSFFPLSNLPAWLQNAAGILPLSLTNQLLRAEAWSARAGMDILLLTITGSLLFFLGVRQLKAYSE